MAVSQMERISILAASPLKESILKIIQSRQALEIIDLTDDEEKINLLTGTTQLSPKDLETRRELEEQIRRVQHAIDFIQQNSVAPDKNALKRAEMTLDELEKGFDTEVFNQRLTRIEELEKQLLRLKEEARQKAEAEEELRRWQTLDFAPADDEIFQNVNSLLGSVNVQNQPLFLEKIKELPDVYCEEVYTGQHDTDYFLVYLQEIAPEMKAIFDQVGFRRQHYPYQDPPQEALRDVQAALQKLSAEEKAVKQKITKEHEAIREMALSEELLLARLHRRDAAEELIESKDLFLLEGWITKDEEQPFLDYLHQFFKPEEVVVVFEKAEDTPLEKIPTKLKNNQFVQPFEMLTEMYSLPKYNEIDPTPYMMPFYMVFFGMMVADAGYGLLLFLITLFARKKMVLKRSMKTFVDFFFLLSIAVIIWGIIYGSFFGHEFPETIFGMNSPFPLLSTSGDVNAILILSVVFGFIQILFGLMVCGVEHIKRKEYLDSINNAFAWQGILIGLVLILLGKMVIKNQTLATVGIILSVVSAVCIIVIPMLQRKSKMKGLAVGMYNLYGLSGYIGDLVSYTRLMALGISGGSIAAAFNMLVEFMPPVARFTIGILLLIVLHALNIFLSLLSAYVHGARLQYVEFFGKFYNGGGRGFSPLATDEKYVNIKPTNHTDGGN